MSPLLRRSSLMLHSPLEKRACPCKHSKSDVKPAATPCCRLSNQTIGCPCQDMAEELKPPVWVALRGVGQWLGWI